MVLIHFLILNLNPLITIVQVVQINSGWSILVVYEDQFTTQQVNVYDGLASVFGFEDNASTTIDIESLNIIDTQDARWDIWHGMVPNTHF